MATIDGTNGGVERVEWKRDRPQMPGYGVPDTEDGLLDLAAVRERLTAAKNYWICTASSDGVPHAVPVWAACVNDTIYFGAGPRSTRNLLANPAVTVHLESADEVVITQGVVERVHDPAPALSKAIDDQYAEKYDWRPSSESETPVGDGSFALLPQRIIAWTSFPADATRWTRISE
jgi:hypothetical protein